MDTGNSPDRRRVRVLFGPHVLATYSAAADLAERYAAAIRGHFVGLDVKVDNFTTGYEPPVPCERLWELAP